MVSSIFTKLWSHLVNVPATCIITSIWSLINSCTWHDMKCCEWCVKLFTLQVLSWKHNDALNFLAICMVPLPICLLQWHIPQYDELTTEQQEWVLVEDQCSISMLQCWGGQLCPRISGNDVFPACHHFTSSSIETTMSCCYTETTPRVLRHFCFLTPYLVDHIKQVQDWVVISHQIYISVTASDFGMLQSWWHWWCWLPHSIFLLYVQILHTGRPFLSHSRRQETTKNKELMQDAHRSMSKRRPF